MGSMLCGTAARKEQQNKTEIQCVTVGPVGKSELASLDYALYLSDCWDPAERRYAAEHLDGIPWNKKLPMLIAICREEAYHSRHSTAVRHAISGVRYAWAELSEPVCQLCLSLDMDDFPDFESGREFMGWVAVQRPWPTALLKAARSGCASIALENADPAVLQRFPIKIGAALKEVRTDRGRVTGSPGLMSLPDSVLEDGVISELSLPEAARLFLSSSRFASMILDSETAAVVCLRAVQMASAECLCVEDINLQKYNQIQRYWPPPLEDIEKKATADLENERAAVRERIGQLISAQQQARRPVRLRVVGPARL